jgi:TetR/AcrR family transcriptional regulator, cholesterol catabolism regulator
MTQTGERERESPAVGRRERKKLQVERRLRSAALVLFREKGYEATTVEEIAERADVAKGTFFNYFPRKDALLEALLDDLFRRLLGDLGPVETWEGTARDQLLRLFLRIGEAVGQDPELSKVMVIENTRRYWMRAEADPLELELRALLEVVLRRARDRGEIRPEADVALSARLVEAAHVTAVIEWLKSGARMSAYGEELRGRLDIIFRGLGMTGLAVKG